jgi:hypothetical protein
VRVHRIFSEPLDDDERLRAEGALGVLAMFTAWDGTSRTFRPVSPDGADPGAVLRALGRVVEGDWADPFDVGGSTTEGEHPLVARLRELLRA